MSYLPLRWQVSDAPADFLHKMLRSIVGIEIPVQRRIKAHEG